MEAVVNLCIMRAAGVVSSRQVHASAALPFSAESAHHSHACCTDFQPETWKTKGAKFGASFKSASSKGATATKTAATNTSQR